LDHCEAAASKAGFSRFQLTATLPGVPFYLAQGYRELDHQSYELPNGEKIGFVAMIKVSASL
jgi:hypothetical protein